MPDATNSEPKERTLEEVLRPPAEIRRSLLGTLEDSGMLEPGLAEYEWRRYMTKSETAKRFLRALLQGPMVLMSNGSWYRDAFHSQFGTYGADEVDEQRALLMSLLTDAFVCCSTHDDREVFTISGRGMRVLGMEYGGDPFGLVKHQEMRDFFEIEEIKSRIQALGRKFQSYYSNDITPEKIESFLGQMEVRSDARRMLAILEEVRFYSKREVTRILAHYLREATQEVQDYVYVLFGNFADSTAEMSQTVLKELMTDEESSQRVCSLTDALSRAGDHALIFVDDIVGSGTQSEQIFRELLGKWDREYEHFSAPLSDELQGSLRRRSLRLVCCHGHRKGITRLREFAKNESLDLDILCDQVAEPDVFSDSFIPYLWSNTHNRDYWVQRFTSLGMKLLADDGRKESLQRRDALGWKRSRGLTVYAHNVPTTTLTFLWKSYAGPDGSWMSLFPRRE